MNFSKKIASIAVAAVLGIAGLTAVSLTAGHSGGMFDHGASAKHGKQGKSMCHRGQGGKHGKSGHHRKGPDYLAKKLSVMETEIGIRAEQLDTWRNFTDALQATMKRSKRPGGPGMMAPSANAEPFSLAEGFADRAIKRAESAEKLKEAIAALRTTLTADQLEKVEAIEARLRSRMAKHHGWKRGPHGPRGKGPHCPPQAGPASGSDTGPADKSDDDDDDDDDA